MSFFILAVLRVKSLAILKTIKGKKKGYLENIDFIDLKANTKFIISVN